MDAWPITAYLSKPQTPRVNRVLPLLLIWLLPALPLHFIHLRAAVMMPELRPYHGIVASLAQPFGPWAGVVVYLAGFPNAGLRSVDPIFSTTLTLVAVLVAGCALAVRQRPYRWIAYACFAVVMLVWYGAGFVQITDGLL